MKILLESILLSLILSFLPTSTDAQYLRQLGPLAPALIEVSGMEYSSNANLWVHNDSGSAPGLFLIDTGGNILKTIVVAKSQQKDWEDLTIDASGNLYIGDFGNNANNRKDLVIYKIPDPLKGTSDTVMADTIKFNYPDQVAFPPPATNLNYDMEAMIWFDDSLHLFTKNRTSPFDGYCRHYVVPDVPGNYNAILLDSIYLSASFVDGWVTGADLDTSSGQLALISNRNIYLFDNYIGRAFFKGQMTSLSLGPIKQYEAICFIHPGKLYIGEELGFGTQPYIYEYNLSAAMSSFDGMGSGGDHRQLTRPLAGGRIEVLENLECVQAYNLQGQLIMSVSNLERGASFRLEQNVHSSSLVLLRAWSQDGLIEVRRMFIEIE